MSHPNGRGAYAAWQCAVSCSSSARWSGWTRCSTRRSRRSSPTSRKPSASRRRGSACSSPRTRPARSWVGCRAEPRPRGSAPRRAVLVGLALMGLASLGFAFAHGFWALAGARFLQGVGSGFTWAGAFAWLLAATPSGRRGEVIGTAMGAAVFGALIGPVVGGGGGARRARRRLHRARGALGRARRLDAAPRVGSAGACRPSLRCGRALRDNLFVGGLVLMALPSFLFGVLSTLAPLHLAAAGWGAAAIGGRLARRRRVETAVSPVAGRVLDRRGVCSRSRSRSPPPSRSRSASRSARARSPTCRSDRPGGRSVRRALHSRVRPDRRGRRAEPAAAGDGLRPDERSLGDWAR